MPEFVGLDSVKSRDRVCIGVVAGSEIRDSGVLAKVCSVCKGVGVASSCVG